MNSTFMKEKPVGPLLASMALPMVFSMLVNSLYNIVDSFFVAQISEQAMTALSLVYPIQNMINAVAIGFGIGINARVSYHLGAGDKKMADTAATHGFFLSVIHGILMTVISIAVMPVFLQMFTQDETVIRMGLEYSTIVFLFSTVIAISLFFEKLFQAVGRMKVSMLALLVGCISNIILDPFLGSGSTLMACQQTGRICCGIELDEKFVDVIVRRYISEYGDAGVFVLRGDEKIPYAEVADDGTD